MTPLPALLELIERLEKRAAIRRTAKGRKSVAQGQPDRIADLLEEAATALRDAARDAERWRTLRQLSHHIVLQIIQSDWGEWEKLIDEHAAAITTAREAK